MKRKDFLKKTGLFAGLFSLGLFETACMSAVKETEGSIPKSSRPKTDCEFTPDFTEGPFYVNKKLLRSDITEEITGQAMEIQLQLVNAETCQPLPGLQVDIWMTNPEGVYSGVDNGLLLEKGINTEGQTFMRGSQIADEKGIVSFKSLFPGWYPITPPHFHYSVKVQEKVGFTSQFFFEDTFSKGIYTSMEPYKDRGEHPIKVSQFTPEKLILVPEKKENKLWVQKIIGINMNNLKPVCGYKEQGC